MEEAKTVEQRQSGSIKDASNALIHALALSDDNVMEMKKRHGDAFSSSAQDAEDWISEALNGNAKSVLAQLREATKPDESRYLVTLLRFKDHMQLGEDETKRERCDSKNSDVDSSKGSQAGSRHGSSKTGGTADMSAYTAPSQYRNSGAFAHGTKFKNFKPIMEQGLKALSSEISMIDEVRSDGRVPGLKSPPEILILIDENKARMENMFFDYDKENGTWKTSGINGVIRPWFFQKVVDQRPATRGNVLFQSKEDPMMRANVLRSGQRPKKLIHATYWENIYGILNNGIQPGKNPTSSLRRPFKTLIQGAENVVYTVNANSRRNSMSRQVSSQVDTENQGDSSFAWSSDDLGMERRPDVVIVIDTEKLGVDDITLVQSAEHLNNVLVAGRIPLEALAQVEANEPEGLPDDLKAACVNPKPSFEEIPVIDISKDESEVIEQLRYACTVVGFMQIRGHGVPDELIARHMELQRKFFALPQEEKDKLRLNSDNPVRGYFGKGGEDLESVLGKQVDEADGTKIAKQARKDNKEALDTNGVPWSKPVTSGYVAKVFSLPSQFPTEEVLPGFREVLDEYAKSVFELSRKLLSLMAQVLGLDKDYFEPHLINPVATHRLLHYPPMRDVKDFKEEIGVGAHTDYGLLTILRQDSTGGLQVLNAKEDIWVHCPPIEDAFVVNIGDMLERWTAKLFKSTVHRVVNMTPLDRYSIPYFLEPNMDSMIVPGQLCLGLASPDDPHREALKTDGTLSKSETAEDILGRFYYASGQLKKPS